jgi:hypothetical protein
MTRATITAEQSQAVAASRGQPVFLVDERGEDAALAIVRVDLLGALAAGGDLDIVETYAAAESALSAIWNEPELDEYTEQDGSPID